MYKRIMQDLETADPYNVGATKKLLGKIHFHIKYCQKTKNAWQLNETARALRDFLSANKSKFDIEIREKPGSSYMIRRFVGELIQFADRCEKEI